MTAQFTYTDTRLEKTNTPPTVGNSTMPHEYTPRRCSKRWLDGDCPREVLAIIDHGNKQGAERFDVIYTDVMDDGRDKWLTYICLTEHGSGYHGELKAHQVAAYRYRMKHRYATWSSLPDAVKNAVRADIVMAMP